MIQLYNRALAAAGGTDLLTQKESYILLQCRGMHNVSPSLLKKKMYICMKKVCMILCKHLAMEISGCGISGGLIFLGFILPLYLYFLFSDFVLCIIKN